MSLYRVIEDTYINEFGILGRLFKNKDVTGKRYFNCVALYIDEEETKRRKSRSKIWRCKCDCGKEFYAPIYRLEANEIKACSFCAISNAMKTHGMSDTPFYNVWKKIIRSEEHTSELQSLL